MTEKIRTKLRDARRKRRPLPEELPSASPNKVTHRGEDYPTTGDFFEVDDWGQIYDERCEECGRTLRVRTQRDEAPEYYTDVVVQCICGGRVEFILPVN